MSLAPILPSFLSDLSWMFAPTFTVVPSYTFCTQVTLKYMDCLEAYGLHKGREKCAALHFDWTECQRSQFQTYRASAIRRERMRQYREGKIDKPFDEYPPLDCYIFLM